MTKRVETGTVQFGDDWPSVLIRGDNALGWALHLESAITRIEPEAPIEAAMLRGLLDTLRSCQVPAARPVKLLPYASCVQRPRKGDPLVSQSAHTPVCTRIYKGDLSGPLLPLPSSLRAGYSNRSTSKEAANALAGGSLAVDTIRVQEWFAHRGEQGGTADEFLSVAPDWIGRDVDHSTTSARVSDLSRLHGLLVDSGFRRKTRKLRWAVVYVDARLRPWWSCTEGCAADYPGLAREGEHDTPSAPSSALTPEERRAAFLARLNS